MPGKKDLQNVINSKGECGLAEQKPTGMSLWSVTAVIPTNEGNTSGNIKAFQVHTAQEFH